jgi:deazaflavin-dependent oxidoreductase (nitroreductase family)
MTLWHNFRGDLFGGVTAAVVALPLALAFGVASGVGPLAGLYGAIFAGFFAAALLSLTVAVIGEVPSCLPTIMLPGIALDDVGFIVRFSLILAFLGSIDSLLTSNVVDSMTRTQHDSNRERIGQGIGNAVAGLLGGVPSAGATMRTVVNVRAGGKTPLSGAIHSGLLLIIVLGAGAVVQHIPHAVLAGILLKVGIDIIDWKAIGRSARAPRAGVVIMLSTLLLTVFVDLITAVAVGFVMASVLFVARPADAPVSNAKIAFGADQIDDLSDEEEAILVHARGRIVLFHVEGPLSFGSARDIARLMPADIEKDVLAIDMRDVPFIDSSASFALDEVIQRLNEDGDTVLLFGARDNVIETLRKTEVIERHGPGAIFPGRTEALRHAETLVEVLDPNGPGSPGWQAAGSHTQRMNNELMRALRENGGKVPGELEDIPMLIITTTGAKSAQRRAVPLAYLVIDERLVIIASMGGAAKHPPWYHNLVANPDVTVEKDGATFAAVAHVTEGADRDRLFQTICANFAVFAEYQARTERVIPVIELLRERAD